METAEMKTVWIFNQYNMPPEYGHLNRHYNFGRFLKASGYRPVVFVGSFLHNTNIQMINNKSHYKFYENGDYPYIFIRTCDYSKSRLKRIYAMFEYNRNLYKTIKGLERPDVIIGSSAHPLAAIAAIKLAKKYKCKAIVEVRDLWPESFVTYGLISKNNPIMKLLYAGEKWIYKKADKLIFTMEGGRDYIIDKGWDTGSGGPIDLKKVFHINNGVDLEEYNYNKTRFSFPDEDLDKDNTFKIIYTGSLRAANNQIWALLKTAELFKDEKYKDIIFLIYGDGPERSLLEYYCEERALKNVHIKGRVEKKYIPYILSQADINILNCEKYDVLKYGGSQNKLFEYLASGHPIITAEATKYSVVRKYNCGIAWDFKDAQEIKEAILELKNLEPNQLAEMQKNINTTALKYDFGNLTKELIEVIETGDK